jgi:Tol biopolymer transport system component
MPLSPGEKLGPYEILAAIGAGGFGEVYKARDTRLDRTVAVKVLPERIAQRDDLRARFEREARAVASLNHPNICTLHDIGRHEEQSYMVMELIDGETLAARIAKGAIPLDQALKLAAQIADALDRAHRAGVTHRDVKPQNIMLTRDGVKVLDFGLAKSAAPKPGPSEETLTQALTTEGTVMGTPQYMAPELFEGKEADARADIWAFGAVLYEMVTGRKAFEGKSYASLLGAILSANPPPMAVKPFTPAWLERMVRRCLAKDPEDRWQSMRDIVLELRTPPPESVPAAALSKAPRWPWAIACAALLAAVAWTWFHRPAATAPAVAYNLEVSPPDGESLYQDATSGIQAISPDGRTLAFIAGSKGVRHIWLRPLDSPVARSLAGTELAGGVFWSPDSRHLGFMAGNKLLRVDLATGAIKEICDAGNIPRGASWNAAGVILFATTSSPLRRVPADGGTPVPVTAMGQSEANQFYPQFLPDGKQFIYWSRSGSADVPGVHAGTLDLPPDRQPLKKVLASPSAAIYTVPAGASAGYLLFLRGRSVVAQPFDPAGLTLTGSPRPVADNVGFRNGLAQYSVSGNGILAVASAGDLFRTVSIVSPEGETISTAGKPDAYVVVRLSPDGRLVALVKSIPDSTIELWLMDLAHGSPVPFTNNAGLNLYPVWSPQGGELLYSVFRDGRYRMYRKAVSSSGAEQLVQLSDINQLSGDWIPNPPRIVYAERSAGSVQHMIATLPLTQGGKPIVIDGSNSAKFGPRVSPSGRLVAYASDESGAFEIYIRSMPDGEREAGPRIRISTGGGANAAWSADGNTLFYNSPDDRLFSVKLKVVGDGLEPGEPKPMFPLGGTSAFNGAIYWEPIGNGQRFVVLRSAPVTGRDNRINVLLNWQAGSN